VFRGIGAGRVLLQSNDAGIAIEPAVLDVPRGGELTVEVKWQKREK
jgi:hypothetical protein